MDLSSYIQIYHFANKASMQLVGDISRKFAKKEMADEQGEFG